MSSSSSNSSSNSSNSSSSSINLTKRQKFSNFSRNFKTFKKSMTSFKVNSPRSRNKMLSIQQPHLHRCISCKSSYLQRKKGKRLRLLLPLLHLQRPKGFKVSCRHREIESSTWRVQYPVMSLVCSLKQMNFQVQITPSCSKNCYCLCICLPKLCLRCVRLTQSFSS